jgi:methylamine dehydrogenase accessory protein MauD
MDPLVFAVALLWVVVLVLIGIVFALARQVGVLLERVQPVGAMISDNGPEIGSRVPAMTLPNLNGAPLALGNGSGARSQLVFFLSTTCPICKALIPALRSAARSEADWLDVVLASDGNPQVHRDMIAREGLGDFPYTLSSELGMTFKVAKLPFAVLIDGKGEVRAKGLVNNREQLESLFHASELGRPSLQSLARGDTIQPA